MRGGCSFYGLWGSLKFVYFSSKVDDLTVYFFRPIIKLLSYETFSEDSTSDEGT
jgi:hypothetical protein